jgi:hypothetical protein
MRGIAAVLLLLASAALADERLPRCSPYEGRCGPKFGCCEKGSCCRSGGRYLKGGWRCQAGPCPDADGKKPVPLDP